MYITRFLMFGHYTIWMWTSIASFIGREDQSVNEKVMISRIDQQIYVTKSMISMYELRMIESKKLRKYMINYLAIMMTVSSILCIRSKVNENLK